MNLIPKDKKFAIIFKFRLKKEKPIAHRTFTILYGNYALKAKTPGF